MKNKNKRDQELPNKGLPLVGFVFGLGLRSVKTLTSSMEEEGIGLSSKRLVSVLMN